MKKNHFWKMKYFNGNSFNTFKIEFSANRWPTYETNHKLLTWTTIHFSENDLAQRGLFQLRRTKFPSFPAQNIMKNVYYVWKKYWNRTIHPTRAIRRLSIHSLNNWSETYRLRIYRLRTDARFFFSARFFSWKKFRIKSVWKKTRV